MTTDQDTVTTETHKPRRWPWIVAIVGAFILGIIIGAAAGTAEVAEPETETVEVEVPGEVPPEALAELEEREAALAQREGELEAVAAELEAFAAELDNREAAITETELEIDEGTIPGPGIYLVGEDIEPGTYRINGDDCYWARLSGLTGDEIITNGFAQGPYVLEIPASDVAFENTCTAPWVRQ